MPYCVSEVGVGGFRKANAMTRLQWQRHTAHDHNLPKGNPSHEWHWYSAVGKRGVYRLSPAWSDPTLTFGNGDPVPLYIVYWTVRCDGVGCGYPVHLNKLNTRTREYAYGRYNAKVALTEARALAQAHENQGVQGEDIGRRGLKKP